MIKNNGYEYSAVVNIKAKIKFNAHNEDEALDKLQEFMDDLGYSDDCKIERWWWDKLERGDKALDITEDE